MVVPGHLGRVQFGLRAGRVDDERGDRTEAGGDVGNEIRDGGLVRHIGGERVGGPARCTYVRDHLVG